MQVEFAKVYVIEWLLFCCSSVESKVNKDIVCLPHQPSDNALLPIPRGEKRSKFAEMGLIGEVALHSVWQAAQVEAEISSVFASAFGLSQGEVLPYIYLRYNTYMVERTHLIH